MTKKDKIISIYPKFLNGELSFKEIAELCECSLDNVYKTVNPVFFKKKDKDTDTEILEYAHSVNVYSEKKEWIIGDWDNMTIDEKSLYL